VTKLEDDDWELFVPVKGEKYPDACQYKYRRIDHEWSEWCRGPIGVADYPRNDTYQYRRPKQKETKMPVRTPQQALRDAIDSGAVEAWINGEDIQYRVYHPGGSEDGWVHVDNTQYPDFSLFGVEYRPKPPEPTKINWQPVVTGKEPIGTCICWYPSSSGRYSSGNIKTASFNSKTGWSTLGTPTHWAPMSNLPEGDK